MAAFEKGRWQDELKPFGITEVKEFSSPTELLKCRLCWEEIWMLPMLLPLRRYCYIPRIGCLKIVTAVNINGSNLVLRSDNYSGPQSLAGLNIATFPPGTIQDLVLKKWLKDNNVDIERSISKV
jgi:NitT/TauT family transport system substrate-binding protein